MTDITDTLQNLPMLRLRQEMLRRAKLALGEAQVLSALLDSFKNQPVNMTCLARPSRTLFGFQLLHPPNHSFLTLQTPHCALNTSASPVVSARDSSPSSTSAASTSPSAPIAEVA
jgi:hypothetical protein